MTYNLLYKVGQNKMYKIYMHGEFREVHQSYNDLHARATSKKFRIISRSYGGLGVILNYSDGKQNVNIVICSEDERKAYWLENIEY